MFIFPKRVLRVLPALLLTSLFFACSTVAQHKTEATSVLATEEGIMYELGPKKNSLSETWIADFPVVMPTETINMKIYRDVEADLSIYTTFNFDYTSTSNPLLEKELFHKLEKVLRDRGMTRVTENPQILISMDFFIGKKEQYTPPTTVTSTELQTVWNTGFIGWNAMGSSSQVPVTSSTTTSGYTTVTYYSNIRLNFLDYSKLTGKVKPKLPPLIWMGEADNEGIDSDIRGIGGAMFSELAAEFPNDSGKGPKRFVRCFRYGSLGFGFDPTNWKVINYIEPGSVAAANGIRVGDVLVRINGETAANWIAGLYWDSPANTYRREDPYYRFILSNRGESDVEVVIKSGETGKWYTKSMRPRVIDRFITVTEAGMPIQHSKKTKM